MRKLRIAAPVQLPLDLGGAFSSPAHRWLLLPEITRQTVLVLLARLIARGVLAGEANDE